MRMPHGKMLVLASDELMRKRQGRKALVLLTDGVDNGSKVPLSQAIESAQRADTLVYSIWFTGEEQQAQQPFGGGGFGGRRRGGGFPGPRSPLASDPDCENGGRYRSLRCLRLVECFAAHRTASATRHGCCQPDCRHPSARSPDYKFRDSHGASHESL